MPDTENPNDVTVISNAEDKAKADIGPMDRPDNEKFQKLVDHCNDLRKAFENSTYRADKIKEILQSRKAYEQIGDKKSLPWEDASNLVMPLDTITVDNLEPRLHSGFIGREPIVRFEMNAIQEQTDPVKLLEAWFNQELKNIVKIKKQAMGIVHIILLEGTWFGVPGYNRHEETRRDFRFNQDGTILFHGPVQIDPKSGQPIMGQNGQPQPDPEVGKPYTEDKVDVLFEGGEIERIPFTDVLCADDIGTDEQWEKADKGFISRPTYAELQRNKNKVGYLPDKIGPWMIPHQGTLKMPSKDQSPEQEVAKVEVTGKETVKCYNWFLSYPINRVEEDSAEEQSDFTEEKIFVTITEGGVLIRLAYLREFNFSGRSLLRRIRLFSEEGRSYGTSIYGKIKSIQDGCSEFFNQVLNSALVCMIPWFFHDETSGIDRDVELYPGKGVKVDNVKGILIPPFFQLDPSRYLAFVNIFIDLWERLGSIANPQIGKPASGEKTATEIMTVIQEGNIKFEYQVQTTQDEFISLIQVLYDLYYQYMPFNKTFNYNGQQVPIPRKVMKQGVSFRLSGSTAFANKMIERRESEELFAMAAQNPLVNLYAVTEDLLKAYGKSDMKKYINPQLRQILETAKVNPEISQVIGKYMQDKIQMMEAVGVKPKRGGQGGPG